ncbi:hypothetical protein BUALT_Bualt05G0108700 [Buddleja alternifolia]|uniref:Protein BCCIP homolog n=1 Tax=Buddleja alternifolia TaxID=168488 RepID=A0AAV6XUR5_9LAMI|nr:hypothetical protein BUALT_Bualt05G0108700 [Buddleja alternifolia]
MPRKPTRHDQLLRNRPLTFSPFARAMAMATSSKKARQEMREPYSQTKDFPTSSGNEFLNRGKDTTKQYDSSDNEDFEGVVQADFAFFDPKPSDYHGVKVLLQTYLDDKQWDLSGFVDLILGQPTVGTVVKIEDDEDDGVYSVVSALNLERYKGSKSIVELKNYLLKVCQDMDVIANLRSLLGEHALDVGLIVSQRVVNLPPQLLPPLYDGLFDEIEWATEDEPTQELQRSFRFKFYLIISKLYKHKNANQTKGTKARDEDVIYIKPEDEIFLEDPIVDSFEKCFCSLAHGPSVFPCTCNRSQLMRQLKNYQLMGLVMAVEASKIPLFRKQLQALIDE